MHLARWESAQLALSTLAVGSGAQLGGLATGALENTLELLADVLDALSARSRDGSNVSIVGVDADNISCHTVGLEARDDDISWATVLGAVSALNGRVSLLSKRRRE
jgi:hypothetical protein